VTAEGPSRLTGRIYNGCVAGEILIVRGYCDGREGWYELFLGLILFFYVGSPSSSVRSGGTVFSTGCLVPQPFATGGQGRRYRVGRVGHDPP
jgi:hypothetical protein